jgi:hypothetical protein
MGELDITEMLSIALHAVITRISGVTMSHFISASGGPAGLGSEVEANPAGRSLSYPVYGAVTCSQIWFSHPCEVVHGVSELEIGGHEIT